MSESSRSHIGERLAEARESRGLNRAQLAEALDVSRQAISSYEKGTRFPALDVLNKAAEHLSFPLNRFTRPPIQSDDPFFFRSLAAATKTARVRARRRHNWVRADISGYLGELVEFPAVNFPTPCLPDDPSEIDFDDIESIAADTRRNWGLGDGPIGDVVLLLENNGAITVQQELGARTLDAFSQWDRAEARPYIVLGSDKQSAVRSRYNAAHELGHMILHRHLRPALVSSLEMHKLLEEQAHRFSGAFLMPAATFGADVSRPTISSFVTAKPRWRVAIGAMIKRARHIGILSESEETRLFTYRSQRGWAKREPFDDELEVEHPVLIERSFNLLLREGLATKASIESSVDLYATDIESAVGLEQGFLGDDVHNFTFPRLNVR